MPIELIPYSQNVNPTRDVICCVINSHDNRLDHEIFQFLRSKGWTIYYSTGHTVDNMSRMMLRDDCFSEKTISGLDIWNLFVSEAFYERYWEIATRDGRDETEWVPG